MKSFKLKKISAVILSLAMILTFLPALTAFAAGPYTFGYDANSGDGSALPASKSIPFDANVFITLIVPTHSGGYDFLGWSENDSATVATHQPGSLIFVNKATTLYAIWDTAPVPPALTFSLTYDGGLGVSVPLARTFPIATSITVSPLVPQRAGETFRFWVNLDTQEEYAPRASILVDGAITLTAVWSDTKYKVSFDLGGGSSLSPQTVPYGGQAEEPDEPEKTDYTFLGWFTDDDEAWDFQTPVTDDVTLYAKWQGNPVTVTYDYTDAGGTWDDTSKRVGYTADDYPDVSAPGYTFVYWYADLNDPDTGYNFSATLTGDLTLYAKWTPNPYTVTFVYNNAPVNTPNNPVSTVYGNVFPAGYVPNASQTPDGKTFAGWFRDDGAFADEWILGTDKVTGDITLYAKWTINTYTVSYHTGVFEDVDSVSTEIIVTRMVSYGSPAPDLTMAELGLTKDGYVFKYWMDGLDAEWDFTTPVTGNGYAFYAKWVQQVSVTFKFEGGLYNGSSDDLVKYTDISTPVTALDSVPTKEGYTFAGWYTLPSGGGIPRTPGATNVTGNATWYAKWTPNPYTVTFVYNNAPVNTPNKPVSFDYDEVLPAGYVPTPGETPDGKTFAGWFRDDGAFADKWILGTDKVTGDITLYAKWTINTYTVTFMHETTKLYEYTDVVYDSTISEPTALTAAGWIFKGWYESSNLWNFTTDTVKSDITLTAEFERDFYTVTFEPNGASVAPVVYSGFVYDDTTASAISGFSRTGYNFAEWNTEADGTGTAYNPGDVIEVKGDVVLYAIWTIRQYTITYVYNDGVTPNASETHDYNTVLTPPNPPVRAGYAFAGWFSNAALTTSFNFNTPLAGNRTAYAKWVQQVSVTFKDGDLVIDTWTGDKDAKIDEWPDTPTKTGYTFVEWQWDDNGTLKPWGDWGVGNNIDMYAIWEPNPYTVTYVYNNTSVANKMESRLYDEVLPVDYLPTAGETPEGHTFAGWFRDDGAFADEWILGTDKVTGDITLYAKWTINTYTVTFSINRNELWGTPYTNVAYGNTITAPTSLPFYTGWRLEGWYLSDSDSNHLWDFATDTVTSDITLITHFVPDP